MKIPAHRQHLTSLSRFGRDERGATAILFALMVTPILCISLAALDYTTAYSRQNKLQDTADAATNAAAKLLGGPHSEIEKTVRAYMQANLPAENNTYSYTLSFAPEDKALTMHVNDKVPTSIMKMAGIKEVDIYVESTAERQTPTDDGQGNRRMMSPDAEETFQKTLKNGYQGSEREMREAEEAMRQVIRELEQSGAEAQIRDLLSQFGNY
jgi:Flp pilus assembly protein TadG